MVKQVKSIEEAIALVLKDIEMSDHDNSNLKDVTADTMREVILNNVYDMFNPREYDRRGDDDGFSDVNNMVFTNVQPNGNTVNLTFENITQGNDSMSGERIDEMLENGNGKWDKNVYDNQGRLNSAPRPFAEDTVEALQSNENALTNAVKKDLKKLGYAVK